MHRHHIIPRHEWKKRFGSLQGFNAPDNIVYLTVEQHAQAHRFLYELNKNEYDFISFKVLSGQIGYEEANRLATIAANTGNTYRVGKTQDHCWNKGKTGVYSSETLEKMRQASKGHTYNRGRIHSMETRQNMSISHIGKGRGPRSPEGKENIRQGALLREQRKRELKGTL